MDWNLDCAVPSTKYYLSVLQALQQVTENLHTLFTNLHGLHLFFFFISTDISHLIPKDSVKSREG